jgi:hypothetical protein
VIFLKKKIAGALMPRESFGFMRALLFVSFYKLLELQYLYGLQLTITMLVCNSFRWIALFCIQPHCSANLDSCGLSFCEFLRALGRQYAYFEESHVSLTNVVTQLAYTVHHYSLLFSS